MNERMVYFIKNIILRFTLLGCILPEEGLSFKYLLYYCHNCSGAVCLDKHPFLIDAQFKSVSPTCTCLGSFSGDVFVN